MTVYVDPAVLEWRGRRWCHLTADDDDELHAMAARLGLVRAWFQVREGRPWNNHYDLPEDVRAQAIALGAVAITTAESARLRRAKREGMLAGR